VTELSGVSHLLHFQHEFALATLIAVNPALQAGELTNISSRKP
jgi:hypothetical protein